MTAKEACRPIRRVRFLADGDHLAGGLAESRDQCVDARKLTHGSGGPRIALGHERKIVDCDGPRLCVC